MCSRGCKARRGQVGHVSCLSPKKFVFPRTTITVVSMVNNAGLGIGDKTKRIHETTEDSWDTMM